MLIFNLFFSAGVKELPQSGLFAYAHVEDVAEAHVRALEATEASGRYICYEKVVSEEKLVELIRKLYPDSTVPSRYITIPRSFILYSQPSLIAHPLYIPGISRAGNASKSD